MQFVKGKPPETQFATRPGARAKRREVALGRPGFEPGRIAHMAEFPRPRGTLQCPGFPGRCGPQAIKHLISHCRSRALFI
jgi:hypothetical protein